MDPARDPEEIEEMKEVYSVFDRRGDMKVESERMADVLRSIGLNPKTQDVEQIIEDEKLKGERLDFEAFLEIYDRIQKIEVEFKYKDIVECWRSLDKEQTGMVAMPMFMNLLTRMGDMLTDDQVEELTKAHETPTGQVPYIQVIKTVMNAEDIVNKKV